MNGCVAREFRDFVRALTPRLICHPSEGTGGRGQAQGTHGQHGNMVNFCCRDARLPRISDRGMRRAFQARANRESDLYQTPGLFVQRTCIVALVT